MDKSNLYGWIFHFNHYTEKWSAARREDYNDLFSNRKSTKVLSSSKIETLVELICRTNGKTNKINQLLGSKIKHVIVE